MVGSEAGSDSLIKYQRTLPTDTICTFHFFVIKIEYIFSLNCCKCAFILTALLPYLTDTIFRSTSISWFEAVSQTVMHTFFRSSARATTNVLGYFNWLFSTMFISSLFHHYFIIISSLFFITIIHYVNMYFNIWQDLNSSLIIVCGNNALNSLQCVLGDPFEPAGDIMDPLYPIQIHAIIPCISFPIPILDL